MTNVRTGQPSRGGHGRPSSSASLIHQASITLSNEQTLDLPVTPRLLVSTPGAGRNLFLHGDVLMFGNWDADTKYTNISDDIDAFHAFVIYYGAEFIDATPRIVNSEFFGRPIHTWVRISTTMGISISAGVTFTPETTDDTVDQGFYLYCYNGFPESEGPFTGGDPANETVIAFTFVVWDFTLKRFLTTAESGWNEATRTFA